MPKTILSPSHAQVTRAMDLLLEGIYFPESLRGMDGVGRIEDDNDGDPTRSIAILFGHDGDLHVGTRLGEFRRFRTQAGGGVSPRVYNALLVLAEAMRRDNEEFPCGNPNPEGAARNVTAQPGPLSNADILKLGRKFDLQPNEKDVVICGSELARFAVACLQRAGRPQDHLSEGELLEVAHAIQKDWDGESAEVLENRQLVRFIHLVEEVVDGKVQLSQLARPKRSRESTARKSSEP